jgi:2,5-diamino-6-(ribosylamino)-4(3H)-pyrimidinone 5'-phosphate reductase
VHRRCEKDESDKVTLLLNRLREREEEISRALTALAEESAQGIPIIVEGKKDVETLRELGVEGKIICAKTGGKSLLDVVSDIEQDKPAEVILLLDFDRRGKQITNRIRHNLEKARIKVRLDYWLKLLSSAGKDTQCIEGLNVYLVNLRAKTETLR